MSYQSNGNQVLLGRGKVFFNRLSSAGAATGYKFLGEVSKLELSTQDDILEMRDHTVNSTPVLKKVNKQRDAKVSLTFHEMDKENVAMALMGSVSAFIQTSGSVTAEALTTSVVKGHSYKTVARQISSVVVKKGASTLVLGTDYDIADAATGLIHIREGSVTVSDGDSLTVDYTKAAIASPGLARVVGGNSSFIEGALLFIGDPATGPSADVEIWKASISPSGVLGLIQDDFAGVDLEATILSDPVNHPTEPLYVVQYKS